MTIATASQPLGVAIGYVFPSFFVGADDALPENKEQARHDVYLSLVWQAVMGSIMTLVAFILFKEKPPTPPSRSAAE